MSDAENSIQVTSSTKGRERKMPTLHQRMRIVLADLDSTCTVGFLARLKNNMELNRFAIRSSHCCNISVGKNVSGIRHVLSVRRPCVRYWSAMEDI